MKTLQGILNRRNLSVLFRPIMSLSNGAFRASKGGESEPAESPQHSPHGFSVRTVALSQLPRMVKLS